MIWFPPIAETLARFQVKISIAKDLARCGMRRGTTKAYHAFLDPPGTSRQHYVGLVVSRPNGKEKLRFCGTDQNSSLIAAHKAFNEYLEALTLWDIGATEEVSRSGWACAQTEQEAKGFAYRELIERDSLITHFLCPELKTQILKTPGNTKEFQLVRLQSADPELVVVFCGYYLNHIRRWLIGGACEKNEQHAINKALLEVVMLRKDWHDNPPISASDQPKREAFWTHWESPNDPRVMKNIEAMFTGTGNIQLALSVDRSKLKLKHLRRFSPSHIVIGCEHEELAPLTFGGLWHKSEIRIRELMKKRGLNIKHWLTHPML